MRNIGADLEVTASDLGAGIALLSEKSAYPGGKVCGKSFLTGALPNDKDTPP